MGEELDKGKIGGQKYEGYKWGDNLEFDDETIDFNIDIQRMASSSRAPDDGHDLITLRGAHESNVATQVTSLAIAVEQSFFDRIGNIAEGVTLNKVTISALHQEARDLQEASIPESVQKYIFRRLKREIESTGKKQLLDADISHFFETHT